MDLQPIKEALNNATPGPWVADGQELDETYRGSLYLYSPAANEPVLSASLMLEDAILIANAPTWLAQLVAEVERLRRDAITSDSIARDRGWLDPQAAASLHSEVERLRGVERKALALSDGIEAALELGIAALVSTVNGALAKAAEVQHG